MKVNRRLISLPKTGSMFCKHWDTHSAQFEQNDYGTFSTLLIISLSPFLYSEMPKKKQKKKEQQMNPLQIFVKFLYCRHYLCYKQVCLTPSGKCIFCYIHSPYTFKTSSPPPPQLNYFWQNLTGLLEASWIISSYFKDQFVPPIIPDDGMKPKFSYFKQWSTAWH